MSKNQITKITKLSILNFRYFSFNPLKGPTISLFPYYLKNNQWNKIYKFFLHKISSHAQISSLTNPTRTHFNPNILSLTNYKPLSTSYKPSHAKVKYDCTTLQYSCKDNIHSSLSSPFSSTCQ